MNKPQTDDLVFLRRMLEANNARVISEIRKQVFVTAELIPDALSSMVLLVAEHGVSIQDALAITNDCVRSVTVFSFTLLGERMPTIVPNVQLPTDPVKFWELLAEVYERAVTALATKLTEETKLKLLGAGYYV